MSRVTRKEWYRRVNAEWPAIVPALSGPEATHAFRRLYRYAFKKLPAVPVRLTSGRREAVRRSWNAWYVNPERGWHELVHILSHYAVHGHHAKHARMELRLIREVKRRGWLEGKLRRPEPALKPKPDVRELRRQRTEAAIERWEAKAKRAERALAKLRRRLRYYERIAA